MVTKEEMPKASATNPYAQVAWLFQKRADLAIAEDTKSNYLTAMTHMISFLKEEREAAAKVAYDVNDSFDEYLLIRFKTYIDDQPLSSYSAVTILSAARQTIRTAIDNKWISLQDFIDFSLPSAARETEARLAYSDDEFRSIEVALKQDLKFSKSLLEPYVRTGVGCAPKNTNAYKERGWWREEDNLRWYFENILDCTPLTRTDIRAGGHRSFLANATNLHGGLHEMYRRWRVTAWIGPEVIQPYIFKLVAETGLNPSVAQSLRLDSFQEEHPLTGKAYIKYWKERGHGAEELHPDLLGYGLMGLNEQQIPAIKSIWKEVERLTSAFRHQLPPEKQDLLFVYQSRSVKFPGAPRDFAQHASVTGLWAADFVERHGLKSRNGTPLEFTLARFRPSLVSRLLRKGVDIFVIKAILGHQSILQTLRYIQSHDFMPHARREVHQALERIRENRSAQTKDPKPIATEGNSAQGEVVFSTPLTFCKNVFNPPENIRKAAAIAIGKPCTIFNMCLRCPNVILLEQHLPMLFAMRREYVAAFDSGLANAPHRSFVLQNIFLLDSILDPKLSEWTEETLLDAERKSELIENLVDSVSYRGVHA